MIYLKTNLYPYQKNRGLIDRIIDAIGARVIQTTTQKVDATKPSLLRRFISLGKDENDAEIKEPLGTVTTN